MNDRRRKQKSRQEESDEHDVLLQLVQSKQRLNRLKRSPRPSQSQTHARERETARANARATDFKTPTRLPNSRYRSSLPDESPNNESECHQDIIWDPTSPTTPHRNGRGRRRTAHPKSVDISDIVNRIAPKSRRAEEAESSLLQWIGDNVISCTPEVREPRCKPKSTRQNAAADLLQLAKQFDFNMIQQMEGHFQHAAQTSQEALDEEQDLFGDMEDPQVDNCPPVNSEAERALQDVNGAETNGGDGTADLTLFQDMEDDLDMLFDGATQYTIGRLSGSSQDVTKPREGTNLNAVKGVVRSSNVHQSLAGGANLEPGTSKVSDVPRASDGDDFDDDWCNDDFLEDSLVFEMTQNPQLFPAPQHRSTQKEINNGDKGGAFSQNLVNDNKSSGAFQQNARKEINYRAGVSNLRLGNAQPDHQRNVLGKIMSMKNIQQVHVPPVTVPSLSNLNLNQYQSHRSNANTQSHKPPVVSVPLGTSGASSTWRPQAQAPTTNNSSVSSISGSSRFVPTAPLNTHHYSVNVKVNKNLDVTSEKENHQTAEADGFGDFADEDLDFIFASDDIWDDCTDDDDLFREACEEVECDVPAVPKPVENRKMETVFSSKEKLPSAAANKRQTLHESVTSRQNVPAPSGASTHAQLRASTLKRSTTPAGNPADQTESRTSYKGEYKFTQLSSTSGLRSVSSSVGGQHSVGASSVASLDRSSPRAPDDHQFKKPYGAGNPTCAVSKGVGKATSGRCSDAEIERKKQQAIERRRVRMLVNQNLRAPI